MHRWPLFLFILIALPAAAQEPYPGLNIITPTISSNTYVVDMDGVIVRTYHAADRGAYIAYMFPDESIFRTCRVSGGHFSAAGAAGRIQRINVDDIVIWDYTYATYDYQQHHDIQPMPNGNVLVIAWERKTLQEAIAAGRQNIEGEMWPLLIAEIEPDGATGGNVIWEWHVWDHLIQDADNTKANYGVVADHPELLDINWGTVASFNGDWLHTNSIDYNEELDQIIFSARKTDEFYVIDHSTTTAEAAGHTGGNSGKGGDFLYRWGNPQVYGRGDEVDRRFHVIHGVNWIDPGLIGEGNVLVFNNGDRDGSENDYSSVYEIIPPVDGFGQYSIEPDSAYGPLLPDWRYEDPDSFYAGPTQGGAFRLPGGNTLISGVDQGYVFEVTESGTIVWEYWNGDRVGRAIRFWHDLSATPPGGGGVPAFTLFPNYPNPFNPHTTIRFSLSRESRVRLDVFDVSGRHIVVLSDRRYSAGESSVTWDGTNESGYSVASGVYFVRMRVAGASTTSRKITLLK
jgi:hypothetical protein